MYIQGENVKIDDLFTKDKGTQNRTNVNTSNMSAEITVPKSSLVDLRSTLQTLIQRVHDLESKHTKCEETIQSLNKSVSELKAQNSSLRSSIDKLKAEADSHATSCDSFRKTTKTQLKSLEGLDFTENQVNQNKLNNEINRLSKLCSSLQKQVSNKINAGSSHPDPPRQFSTQAIQVHTNSGLLHLNERKAPNRSDAHANPLVKSADIQVKQQQTTDRPKTRDKITSINKPTSSVTPDSKDEDKGTPDVFLGVTYKRAARYYIHGITKHTTYDGIQNFLRQKGVHVTHLALFKPKGKFSVRSAKVNISPQHASTVESTGFWPEGVTCRKWHSVREWSKICDQRSSEENGDSQHDDVVE